MLTESQQQVLEQLAELVIPADDYPSAGEAGAVAFVQRVLAVDRPDWQPRVERALAVAAGAALDEVLADADGAWLVRLIAQGYYAGEL
ncbi:gluconate 2-dehydrogenase subunit 3 family protein, partial [Kribbella antibiotica]